MFESGVRFIASRLASSGIGVRAVRMLGDGGGYYGFRNPGARIGETSVFVQAVEIIPKRVGYFLKMYSALT